MIETDESCMPNIVADNYAVQVISISLEYLGQNPRSVLYHLPKQGSLRKGHTGNTYLV